MFRLGLGEIFLILIVIFVVAPLDIPKMFRKIGQYLSVLRRMKNDLGNIGQEDIKEIRRKPDRIPRTENDITYDDMAMREVKLLVLDMLERNYDFDQTPRVLLMLFDNFPQIRRKAADILLIDPVFSFERRENLHFREAPIGKMNGTPRLLKKLFSRDRILELSGIIAGIPLKRFEAGMYLLAEMPGFENLDVNTIFSGDKSDRHDHFLSVRKKNIAKRYPRQITLAPSYACNLDCTYCFTRELKHVFPRDMDESELRRILDTVHTSEMKLRQINLFGGEPLSYEKVASAVRDFEERELLFYFSTNGLVETSILQGVLKSPSLTAVTVHVEKDGFYNPEQLRLLYDNCSALAEREIALYFRYNLVQPGYRDWSFLDKYLLSFPQFDFNFAVVFPSLNTPAPRENPEDLPEYAEKIMSLVRYVTPFYKENSRRIAFAKPFPLCAFEEEDLRFLLSHVQIKNVCEIDKNNNTNNLCINPDGSFFPCMALNSEKYRFDGLQRLDGLDSTYYSAVERLLKTPILYRCTECHLYYLGVCQGACYAYTVERKYEAGSRNAVIESNIRE